MFTKPLTQNIDERGRGNLGAEVPARQEKLQANRTDSTYSPTLDVVRLPRVNKGPPDRLDHQLTT